MATDLERLVVQLSADIKGYENGMRKALGVTNSHARAIENRYRKMGATLSSSLSGPLAGLGAALSVREITRYADAWTLAGNKIAASAQSSGVQVRSLSDLRKGADEARVSLEAYTDLYAKLIRSSAGAAKSEEEVALATALVSKAIKAGGATIAEQTATILQLGQALGSGVLQGDELRSLRENAPIIAQSIANEFKTTIGGLKKLGEEGKLTSDRVFRAIINAQKPIEAQFAKTNATISDGLTKLGNAVTEYVGKAFQASGATATINVVLGALAGNLQSVAAAAAAAGVVILSRYVPALLRASAAGTLMVATNPFLLIASAIGAAAFALSAFGDEIQPIQGDLATLGDYASATWDTIKDGVGTTASYISEGFLGAINIVTDAMSGVSVTWAEVGSFIQNAINTQIGAFVALYETVKTTFTMLPAAVAEGMIGAMNLVIFKVEEMIGAVITGVNAVITAINNIPGVDVGLLGGVTLPMIANTYAGAGAAAGEAYAGGIKKALSADYLGDALKPLRDKANLKAFTNKISAAIDGGPSTIPTTGFGGGTPGDAGVGGGGGDKKKKVRKNEYEKEIEQIKKRTAVLQAQTLAQSDLNPLIDDYGYAVEKAKAVQELLTAAQEAGVAVSPEVRASIDALAEGYAQAVVAAKKLDEAQGKIKDRAEEMRELSENTTKGFVQDLLEGASAADALANALGRVGDKLIDMAFNQAFDPKGGVFGGGGGFFGAIAKMFSPTHHHGGVVTGGGPGRMVSPAVFANARRYHDGGVVSQLRPGEVPIIAQAGERVIPKGGGGGSSRIEVVLSQELQARILSEAAGQSILIAQSSSAQVRREVPGIVAKSQLRG